MITYNEILNEFIGPIGIGFGKLFSGFGSRAAKFAIDHPTITGAGKLAGSGAVGIGSWIGAEKVVDHIQDEKDIQTIMKTTGMTEEQAKGYQAAMRNAQHISVNLDPTTSKEHYANQHSLDLKKGIGYGLAGAGVATAAGLGYKALNKNNNQQQRY